jgi:hypothetical protein
LENDLELQTVDSCKASLSKIATEVNKSENLSEKYERLNRFTVTYSTNSHLAFMPFKHSLYNAMGTLVCYKVSEVTFF